MSKSIVVVGSCVIDFISYAQRLPAKGETILGKSFSTGNGGKGANQCVAAAKLGGRTVLVSRVGDDLWGENYTKDLTNTNVDTSHIKVNRGINTGIAQIIVAESGENQIVIVPGANAQLSPADVDEAKDTISSAAVVICQLETPVDSTIKALQLCKGISIFNGAPALKDCDPRLFTLSTIFCVNESEASVYSGLDISSVSDAENAIEKLLQKGCNTVILTLGSEGALVASKQRPKPVHIPAPSVNVVDTTGAGDAFIGGLAYLLAEKPQLDLYKSVAAACYVAADSVTRPGTQKSFPTAMLLKHYFNKK